jgi:hypothetical protein
LSPLGNLIESIRSAEARTKSAIKAGKVVRAGIEADQVSRLSAVIHFMRDPQGPKGYCGSARCPSMTV